MNCLMFIINNDKASFETKYFLEVAENLLELACFSKSRGTQNCINSTLLHENAKNLKVEDHNGYHSR